MHSKFQFRPMKQRKMFYSDIHYYIGTGRKDEGGEGQI
jgi:hypothetical protein